MEYYTAIGIKKEEPDGRFCVETAGELYILGELEAYLWSATIWAFTPKDEMYARMRFFLDAAFPDGRKRGITREDFSFCFQRMCTRGLLAAGVGMEYREAASDLLRRAKLEVAAVPIRERLFAFCYSMEMGNGFKKSMRAFQRTVLDKKEKQVLAMIDRYGDIYGWLTDKKHFPEADSTELFGTLLSLYEKKQVMIKNVREA